MRNTKHKLFHDKSLKRLHDELNICGVVRNHFIALSMRYYRRYGKRLSYKKMSKHLTQLKRLEKYQHWNIPYSWALQNILKRLAQSFREMRTHKRGHPQFKKCQKHKGMTFRGEQVCVEKLLDAQKHERNHPTYHIRLNGRWYRFALHREVKGEIKEVHVTRDALGDVYITVTEDYSEVILEPKTGKVSEGFDMGITDFLTGSDGKRYPSPMFYRHNAQTLAAAQKAYSRKVKGSKNQDRERKNVARIHKKTANQRSDHHWKLAIDLCRNFDILFFEDLNLNGMKRLWGKQVSDLAFGEFLEKLKHQSKKRIRSVLKIGRWIPSTKCCCVCEHKNENLTLADREWICPKCQTYLDRDHNAAINILKEGVASFGLGVVRPIVLLGKIVGYSVESTRLILNSTNAFS